MSGSSTQMVNAVPNSTIILSRVVPDPKDPTKTIVKRIVPEIGKIFAFTKAEADSIMKVTKNKPVLRAPKSDAQGTAAVATLSRVAVPVTGSTPGTRAAPDASAAPKQTRAESNAETVAATPPPAPAQPASGPPTTAKQAKAAAQQTDPEFEDHQL